MDIGIINRSVVAGGIALLSVSSRKFWNDPKAIKDRSFMTN